MRGIGCRPMSTDSAPLILRSTIRNSAPPGPPSASMNTNQPVGSTTVVPFVDREIRSNFFMYSCRRDDVISHDEQCVLYSPHVYADQRYGSVLHRLLLHARHKCSFFCESSTISYQHGMGNDNNTIGSAPLPTLTGIAHPKGKTCYGWPAHAPESHLVLLSARCTDFTW